MLLTNADNYAIIRDITKATFNWGNRQHPNTKGNKMDNVLEMEWMEWLAIVEAFDSQTKQVFNECDELEEELEK